jgi:hypothetical protein
MTKSQDDAMGGAFIFSIIVGFAVGLVCHGDGANMDLSFGVGILTWAGVFMVSGLAIFSAKE